MNAPSILLTVLIAVIFFAIIGRGIYNRKHRRGGGCGSCGGGCAGCACSGACHPTEESK